MLSLTPARAWVAGTVVLCVLLAVASYFLLIGPKRADAAALDQQTTDTSAANDLLATQVAELRAQFAELPEREAELAAVKQAMPEDAAIPTLVRDLDAISVSSGVTLMSLTPGAGVLVPTAVAVAPAAVPAARAAAEGAAPAEGAAATDGTVPAEAAAPAGDLLVSLPTSVVVVGTFAQAQDFVRQLQTELPRAFLVSGLTLTAETAAGVAAGGKPAVGVGDVTLTLTGSVFVLRSATAAAPVTAPGAATTDPGAATTDAPNSTVTN